MAWTHVMSYDDISQMLAGARPGQSLAEWRLAAMAASRLLRGDRQNSQFRIAQSILELQDGLVADDAFLGDLREADPSTAHDMIYGRMLSHQPLAVSVATRLLHPAALAGRSQIAPHALDQLLGELLVSNTASTRDRSLSAARTEFTRAGIITGRKNGTLELTRRDPSTTALLHLLNDELRERHEFADAWAVRSARAAIVFALPPEVMQRHIDELVGMGRMRRSYYGGEPRILAA